ncbi:MAG: hypothetical protein R3300_15200 [Candidatus Promineifilaceae bacterium]|nr:hypothetical protein [Candidatus Promineifilaceae bacterium]
MGKRKRIAWPLAAGLLGSGGLTALYFAIVSLAESPAHAVQLFWDDRWIVLPIIVGFGVQVALYTILKKRLFLPVADTAYSAALTGASAGTSTVAMVACCLHHVTDVLPILGLTAAATLMAQYRLAFMLIGLGTTVLGILVMLVILLSERRKALQHLTPTTEAA